MDNKLNWKDHISYISGKIARGIGMLIKANMGSTYVSNIYKLTILQKKIIRIICQVKPRDHTDPLFKELGIIKVVNIYNYLIGKFMYRWSNNLLPTMFDDLFIYNRDVHHHHTRQYLCFICSCCQIKFEKNVYMLQGSYYLELFTFVGLISFFDRTSVF